VGRTSPPAIPFPCHPNCDMVAGNPLGGSLMRRREFIAGLASAAWPSAARAQQPAMSMIGFLHQQTAETAAQLVTAFRAGLETTGFVEGRNVAIEYRWAEGHNDRLPALATDLVRRQVAAIGTQGDSPRLPSRRQRRRFPSSVHSPAIRSATASLPVSVAPAEISPAFIALVPSSSRSDWSFCARPPPT
jgi:hypothetical protein